MMQTRFRDRRVGGTLARDELAKQVILAPKPFGREYPAVALYSGGVDSTVAPILARRELKTDILLLMVSLGESQNNIQRAVDRAKIIGMDLVILDGAKEFARDYLTEAIRMNGSYWGYPLITPLSRAYMVRKAFEFISATTGTRYLVHGCNVFQNTRFRIEKHASSERNVIPIGPLAAKPMGREEKLRVLEESGINAEAGSDIAEDENLWGRALEGDPLNNLGDVRGKGLFRLTNDLDKAPNEPQKVSIGFEGGLPVSVDGQRMDIDEIILKCRMLGALHGIGRIVVFEETIPELGYKERGVYESPASRLLYAAHEFVEGAVFCKLEREMKRGLDHKWAEIVYRGGWYDQNRVEMSDFAAIIEANVTGLVSLELYKGNVFVVDAEIPKMQRLGGMEGSY